MAASTHLAWELEIAVGCAGFSEKVHRTDWCKDLIFNLEADFEELVDIAQCVHGKVGWNRMQKRTV